MEMKFWFFVIFLSIKGLKIEFNENSNKADENADAKQNPFRLTVIIKEKYCKAYILNIVAKKLKKAQIHIIFL